MVTFQFAVRVAMLLCLAAGSVRAAVRQSLAGQIRAIANEVKANLQDNPLVKGQRLALGQFTGEGKAARDSNYGLAFERQFQSELADVLDDNSKLTLAGSYHFVASEEGDNQGLTVLVVTVQIKNERGKELAAITREVNDSDDISQVLAPTVSLPQDPQASIRERNAALKDAINEPAFDIQNATAVSAKGVPHWSVRIWKKSTFNSEAQPVIPENVKGNAYVQIGIREYYEIEVINQAAHDVVASITVDGLDVANTFATDLGNDGKPMHWPGFLVNKATSSRIRGWLNTIQPTPDKHNVHSFLVTKLGEGAASVRNARGAIGVITVQFREACEPNGTLGRSFGETTRGEGLEEQFTVHDIQIGDNVLSTVSIRYNRPE